MRSAVSQFKTQCYTHGESGPKGSEILDTTVKLFTAVTLTELVLISTHSLHIHQSADCSANNKIGLMQNKAASCNENPIAV